jgi:hypothetical protein
MRPGEIEMLYQLIRDFKCRRILEVGMAHGSSTLVILQALKDSGGGEVVSIDPFQYVDVPGGDEIYQVRGGGMENVRAAGFADTHRLIADYDYLAMPRLVQQNEKFDFVFIDGYHSFDYTFLDFFYADHLLNDHGICAFHDTGFRAVHKVIQFVLRNKSYKLVGPGPQVYTPDLTRRIVHKAWTIATGKSAEARERRLRWQSLAAVQKLTTTVCKQLEVVEF